RPEDALLGRGAGRPGSAPFRRGDVVSAPVRAAAARGELPAARRRVQPLLRDDHRAHLPGDRRRTGDLPSDGPGTGDPELGGAPPSPGVPGGDECPARTLKGPGLTP